MFAYTASGALIRDYRKLAVFQLHGGGLDRAALVATAADNLSTPGIALAAIQFRKAHANILYRYIFQGIGWANSAAAHAQEAGGFSGIDLRRARLKKIKPGTHADAVKNTDLGALAALQAAGQKLFFRAGTGWSKKRHRRCVIRLKPVRENAAPVSLINSFHGALNASYLS